MAKKSFSVDREKAIDLLTQLSFKGVKKYDDEKLAKTLNKLPKTLEDGDDDDLNKKGRKLLDDITDAVNDKIKVEVSGGDDDEDDEKPAKKKGVKADKETKKGKKGKEEKGKGKKARGGLRTEKGGKGEFSLRTQQGHEINRIIEKGPTSRADILKKAKIDMTEKRVDAHVDYLLELGRITETKKGKITLAE